jgi:clan AA aspartic protease (TIGR02281 family)
MSKGGDAIRHGAFVDVVIGGKKLTALVDTGSPHSVLFRDAARRVGLSLSDLRGDPRFYVSGTGPHRVAAVSHKLAPVQIGDITVQNLPVVIVDQHSDPGMDMILGMDFLSRVHVWFDFHSSTLVMQYPPRPSPPRPQ